MTVPVVKPIVEGHGEVAALPVLLRRISGELRWPARIAHPYRAPRASLASPDRLEKLMTERYRETFHQAKFCGLMDLEATWRNSRSFRRLLSAVQRLLEVEAPPWTL